MIDDGLWQRPGTGEMLRIKRFNKICLPPEAAATRGIHNGIQQHLLIHPTPGAPMSHAPIDHFAHKAATFEQNTHQVDNVRQIAETLQRRIALDRSMHLMDFGAGTGLLLAQVAPAVGRITAVDVSPAMNAQLAAKQADLPCPVDILALDLTRELPALRFDGIISSMTLHHIQDIDAIFRSFHTLLKAGGFIGIADLDPEDGSFHSEDTGVHHLGLARERVAEAARAAGFEAVTTELASVIHKPGRDYPVFLLCGRKGGTA